MSLDRHECVLAARHQDPIQNATSAATLVRSLAGQLSAIKAHIHCPDDEFPNDDHLQGRFDELVFQLGLTESYIFLVQEEMKVIAQQIGWKKYAARKRISEFQFEKQGSIHTVNEESDGCTPFLPPAYSDQANDSIQNGTSGVGSSLANLVPLTGSDLAEKVHDFVLNLMQTSSTSRASNHGRQRVARREAKALLKLIETF